LYDRRTNLVLRARDGRDVSLEALWSRPIKTYTCQDSRELFDSRKSRLTIDKTHMAWHMSIEIVMTRGSRRQAEAEQQCSS